MLEHPSDSSQGNLAESSSISLLASNSSSSSPRTVQNTYHDRSENIQPSPIMSSSRDSQISDSKYVPPPPPPSSLPSNNPHSFIKPTERNPHSTPSPSSGAQVHPGYTNINLAAPGFVSQPYPVYQDSKREFGESSEYEIKDNTSKESYNNADYNSVTVIDGEHINPVDAKQRIGSRKKKIILIIVAVIIIIIGVSVGVRLAKNGNDDNNNGIIPVTNNNTGNQSSTSGVTNFPTLPPIPTTIPSTKPTSTTSGSSTTTSSAAASPSSSPETSHGIVPPKPSLPPKGQCSNTTCIDYHDLYVSVCSQDEDYQKCANSCANDSCKATCQFSNPCFKQGSSNMGDCMRYCSTPP